jgi:ABC-type uncharacterized transport system substrate-binding protein
MDSRIERSWTRVSRWRRWIGLWALIVAAVPGTAQAHPHVWIDYELTVMFVKGRVTALHQEWSFDEDFTAAVMRDIVGGQKVTKLDPAEIAKIEKDAFSNLKNYDYFTHVFVGDGKVGVSEVKDFKARLAGPKLIYSFTVPLAQPVDVKTAPVGFGIWDDTYYVDVGPAEGKAPKLEGDGAAACHATVIEDHQHPIYFGSVFPKTVQVAC